jgi:hypothetical protein
MITHVVLFRPRPGLTADERIELVAVLRHAIQSIPSIRGARVGRRVTHGRPYEQAMSVNYEFAALLEFDDLEGLKAYLEHPAHERLATRFFSAVDETLVYDFELAEVDG